MTPEDIIKFVFKHEVVDLELKDVAKKKRKPAWARYISIYLINWVYPQYSQNEVMKYFPALNRSAFSQALKVIKNEMRFNNNFNRKIGMYIDQLSRLNNDIRPFVVNGGVVTRKLLNRRITLKKHIQGYSISIKRLHEGKIEEKNLSLTEEAMDSLMDAYNILRK